jgi:uncharacterized membrane protein
LSAGLRRLAGRPFPAAQRFDAHGRLRVCVEHPQHFDNLLDASFNLIRQNARDNTAVYIRLLEALQAIASSTDPPDQVRRALLRHANLIYRGVAEVNASEDAADIRERYRALELQLSGA